MGIFNMLDRLLVRKRSVLRESPKTFKVYLSIEYNDLWKEMKDRGILVDVIIFLPREFRGVDKILVRKRSLVREGERFKLYLPKQYNDIWESLHREGEKVDLLMVFNVRSWG